MPFIVRPADWSTDGDTVRQLRKTVFIDEQGVAEQEEQDGLDANDDTQHFLGLLDDRPIATGRVLGSGKIGRICVLNEFRGQGHGAATLRAIIQHLIAYAEHGQFYLHAQISALDFYTRLGFVAEGEVFTEANIAHQKMTLGSEDFDRFPTIFGDQVIRFDQAIEFNRHLRAVVQLGARSLDIVSRHLNPGIYSKAAADILSHMVRRHRQAKARILLHSAKELAGSAHPWVLLSQRLPSSIEIRVLVEAPQKPDEGFVLSDRRHLLYFNNEDEHVGFVNYRAQAECEHVLEEFEHLWQYQSRPDPNLKRLML